MSDRADALRNALDRLALDSNTSEDRRYLVSMLRRLGYSDAEIEAEIGPLETDDSRVIEVEYEGPPAGAAPATSRETTFQVGQPGDEGLSFRIADDDAPGAAGTEEVDAADLSGVESDLGDWGDFEQGPRDDRTRVDDTEPTDDWGGTDGPEFGFDDGQGEERVEFRAAQRPDPALEAGWRNPETPASGEEPPAQEAEAPWPEPTPEATPWPEEPGPEAPAEGLDEPAPPAADAPEAPTATGWTSAEQWNPPESSGQADAGPAAGEAFRHGDYTLYTRKVHLSTGREQRIYFFAKNPPQEGDACALPQGYEVVENEKTGLPFLRRQR